MQFKLEKVSGINIAEDGSWSRQAGWLLWPDTIPADPAAVTLWQETVRAWCPGIGAFWRDPAEQPPGWVEDSGWMIRKVDAAMLDDYAWRITWQASPVRWAPEPVVGTIEKTDRDGLRSRTCTWRVPAAGLGAWLPNIGDALQWDGGDFRCTSILLKELAGGDWEVAVAAAEPASPEGRITFRRNHNFEAVKTGVWEFEEARMEAFRSQNEVNCPAVWAGDGYYVTSFGVRPTGKGTWEATVEARHVNVRMLEMRRSESFLGYNRYHQIRRRIRWVSRWRVHRDARSDFENITGTSAREWTGSDSVVTEVEPVRLNDWEYEYTLEAVPLNARWRLDLDYDDRSDLSGRVDLQVETADFLLTAEQCGWQRGSSGEYVAIPRWIPESSCPFVAAVPLGLQYVNAVLKSIQVVETRYYRIYNTALVPQLNNWMAAGRLWHGKLGNFTADWLKENVTTETIVDDAGEVWQKITCSYRMAPAGFRWNEKYWMEQV